MISPDTRALILAKSPEIALSSASNPDNEFAWIMMCLSSNGTFLASRAFLAAISFPTFRFDAAADPEVTTVLATVPVPDAGLL